MRSAWSGVGGVGDARGRRRSTWCRASAPTARPASRRRSRRGSLRQALEAQGVGQPPGRVDGDDGGSAAPPGRLHGEDGGGRRLADAAGAAADDDRRPCRRGSSSGTAVLRASPRHRPRARSIPSRQERAASRSSSSGPRSASNRNGRCSWGSGQRLGQPGDLLGLQRHAARRRNAAAAPSAVGLARPQRHAGLGGGRVGVDRRGPGARG